jgi:phage-related tail fiber protein
VTNFDGKTLVTGDRVLLKNQSAPAENGVYVVVASGAASRATNFDAVSALEVASGALFFVSEGTANNGKAFTLTTTVAITLGTTALDFAEFSDSPEVLAVVEPARPMGYSITHKVVEQFTLTLGDPIYGVLGTAVL